MTIRNRLLVLLLAIALTPLILTSVLQQASIRVARNRLTSRTRETLESAAQGTLQEQLYSHVEILERERQLTDALLRRQVREVELRLANLVPPPVSAEPRGRMDRPDFRPDPNGRGRPMQPPGSGRGGDSASRPRPDPSGGGSRPEPPDRGPRPFMPVVEMALTDYQFGLDPDLASPSTPHHPYLSETTGPNVPCLTVNYRAQSCFVVRDSNETRTKPAMEALATLTPVYEETCTHGPKGILWLHTSLDIGVHTTYPGGVGPRELTRYDPRMTEWYRQARFSFAASKESSRGDPGPGKKPPFDPGASPPGPGPRPGPGERFGPGRGDPFRRARIGVEATQGAPSPDPFTDQVVVVRSAPVRYADGSFAGVTAVARTIPEIFASMQLPERWGTEIERMLVLVDPNSRPGPGVQVLLHDGPAKDNAFRGPRRGGMEGLRSQDAEVLSSVIDDVVKGKSGARKMEYKGKACLWAYQPLDIPQVAALLIVPHDRVVELARTMEESLLQESLFWLQGTTMVLLVAGAGAIILAALKARNVTDPIHALIEAGKRLGNGDYDARVEIKTGDELEHLGRVFNETGPKLRDRERMKQSLDLAAAIQHSLLPEETPSLRQFDVAGRCVYCDETGGDYYDFIALPDTGGYKLGLAVGDVSGHGIGPALLMAATRGMLHVEAPHCANDLGELLRRLNRQLAADAKEGTFVTLFFGVLDDNARSIVWSSAGHEPAIWYHASSRRIEELPNTGLPLGVLANATFEQAGPVILEPGDVLVVGTDGICEARDASDQFFGTERLWSLIENGVTLTASQICDKVIDAVATFVHSASRTDDVTLIVIKAVGPNGNPPV